MTTITAKGSVDDQQAIFWEAVAGFLQQRFRAGGWADVQQVDAHHGLQILHNSGWEGPRALLDIQIQGIRHHASQFGVADPGVDAGPVVGIRITGLPQQLREASLKGDGMFTTAARDLEH